MITLVLATLFNAHAALSPVRTELSCVERDYQVCLEKATTASRSGKCSDVALAAADSLLTRAYKELVKELSRRGDDHHLEILNRLRKSQRAWVNFRDAQCSYESADMLGGTSEAAIVLSCLYDLTKARVLVLLPRLEDF